MENSLIDEPTIEQLITLALDTRDSTTHRLASDKALASSVDDVRKRAVRERARAHLYKMVNDVAEAAYTSEDVGKKTNALKLMHTIAGYDNDVALQQDKAVLIIKMGNGSTLKLESGAEDAPEPSGDVIDVEPTRYARTSLKIDSDPLPDVQEAVEIEETPETPDADIDAVVDEMFNLEDLR